MARLLAVLAAVLTLVVPIVAIAGECPPPCSSRLCDALGEEAPWVLTEARVVHPGDGYIDPTICEITAVHGGPAASTVTVGQQLECFPATTERVLLVLVRDPDGTVSRSTQLQIDDEDRVGCERLVAPLDKVIAAALSDDCDEKADAAGLGAGDCCGACASGGSGICLAALGLVGLSFRRRRQRRI